MIQRLQYFPQEDIKIWVNSSTEYAISLSKVKNNANLQRISVILLTVYHFYDQDDNLLKSFFEMIMKTDDFETAHLSAYCIAKISADKIETNPNLASYYFSIALNLLGNDSKKSNQIMGLHMVKEFASLLPTFFILNCGEIQQTLWVLLFSSNTDVKNLASEMFTQLFITMIKTHAYNLSTRFQEVMNSCLNHIHESKTNSLSSVASVMAEMLRLKPHYFKMSLYDIYYTITPNMQQSKSKFKQKCILIRCLLSAVEPPVFHSEFFKDVFNLLITMMLKSDSVPTLCEAFSILLDFVPDPVIEQVSVILSACIKIVQERDLQNIRSVLGLLKKLISVDPSINLTKGKEIWQIVSGVLFTPNFLDLFPLLNTRNSTFWDEHSSVIIEKILVALDVLSDYSLHALKLIPMLPQLPAVQVQELVPQVKKYLFAKNDELRAAAPKALLHIMFSDDPVEFSKVLKQLIAIAASDTSLTVRISIISSFSSIHFPYLAHDPFLKFLKNLANDNSPQVRSFCFKVLKNTRKYSPIGSDAILRNALINALYALQCSASSFERAHATDSLPALIEASAVLFPIYATTMIPIIIKLLSVRGSTGSVIGSEAETQLTINLIKTIQGILQVNHQTISPYLTQILPIFTTLLKEFSSKQIKKLVIDTLSLFVKKTASTANIYGIAPELLDALLSIAAHSDSKSLKVRALEFLGQCGAVSPQRIPSEQSGTSRADDTIQLNNGTSSQNEYYGSLIFPKLMEMVNDKYLTNFRTQSLSTAITTLSMMSTQSSEHLSQIIPIILNHIMNSVDSARVESIKQLKTLTLVAKQQMFPHVESILNCIYEQWEAPDLNYFIDVIASIVTGLGNDFLPFLYPLVSKIRRSISSSVSTNPYLANSCLTLSATLSAYFPSLCNLFIPQICKTISSVFVSNNIKITALKTLKFLIQKTDPNPYAGSIFSAVSLMCVDKEPAIQNVSLSVLRTMIIIIDKNITYYAHRIFDVLQKDERAFEVFDQIMTQMKQNIKPSLDKPDFPKIEKVTGPLIDSFSTTNNDPKNFVNCFNDDKMYTPKHWQNWYQNLISTSILTSPCSTISCCSQLSSVHKQLAIYLFPAAFSSCWSILSEKDQIILSKKLSQSLQNPQMPNNLLRTLVNLVEQLERVGNGLQFDPKSFINICIRSRSLSFGLHHVQEFYMKDKNEKTLRQFCVFLSEVSKTIDMKPLMSKLTEPISKEFLISLKRWDEAFPIYKEKLLENKEKLTDQEFVGYIFSAQNLFKYKDIIENSPLVLSAYKNTLPRLSQCFTQSSFFADQSLMSFYSSFNSEETLKNLTTKAFAQIYLKKYDDARKTIKKVYEIIATKHSLNFKSPYPVIYPLVVTCQYLYELNEIIETNGNIPKEVWKQRLQNCESNSDVWWNLILPRMVMMPEDQLQFNKFLEITINDKKYNMFECFFDYFYPNFDLSNADYVPSNIYLHYMWSKNERDEVLDKLENIIFSNEKKQVHFTQIMMYVEYVLNDALFNNDLLKQLEEMLKGILNLRKAGITQKWAIVNYYLFKNNPNEKGYAIEGMKSYANCLQLQPFVAFSDICAVLSLFFQICYDNELFLTAINFIKSIPLQKMQEVIPQLFSFMFSPNQNAQQIATGLLLDIYHSQPHNVLMFCQSFSDMNQNNMILSSILNIFAVENSVLYTETLSFRKLITNASQTIFEQWLQSSRELINALLTDDQMPKSNFDHLFYKLNEAHIKEIIMLMSSKEPKFVDNPQVRVSQVNKSAQQIASNCQDFVRRLEKIRLSDVMNNAPNFENSQLIIPGMSSSKGLALVKDDLIVIPVKTRPRQITLLGKDGNEYNFLIRGQDSTIFNARATQFQMLIKLFLRRALGNSAEFPLTINNLIQISHNISLIQYSRDSQFLEQVITKYRQQIQVDHLIEIRDISNLTTQRVDQLRPIQRLEALNEIPTREDDLRKALWAMSSSSDEWYEKCEGFSSSLSYSSCVGSLVWLGGRCPSNILVNSKTGEITHIDYSLAFKGGLKLIQFTDEVPFRLTPMLVSALGIGGLNTSFIPNFVKIHSIFSDFSYLVLPSFYLYAEEPPLPFIGQPSFETKREILDNVFDVLYSQKETPESYVQRLIDAATNKYSLAKQHSTWRPFW